MKSGFWHFCSRPDCPNLFECMHQMGEDDAICEKLCGLCGAPLLRRRWFPSNEPEESPE